MHVPRVMVGALAGLVCLTPLVLIAPARAAESLTTLSTLKVGVYVPLNPGGGFGTVPYKEGDSVSYATTFELGASVRASDGSLQQQGGATLQIRTATNHAWTDHASFPDWRQIGEYHSFLPDRSADYRLVYSGYVAQSGSEDSYAPSASAPFTINVSRAIKAKTRGLRVSGKVSPDYKNRKVRVLRKDGKKYVPFAMVKTDQKSRFRVKLPAGKPGTRLRLRLLIPGNTRFAATVEDSTLRY